MELMIYNHLKKASKSPHFSKILLFGPIHFPLYLHFLYFARFSLNLQNFNLCEIFGILQNLNHLYSEIFNDESMWVHKIDIKITIPKIKKWNVPEFVKKQTLNILTIRRGRKPLDAVHLKGQSKEIFDLQFFSSFEPALATDQWVKIFSNLVKNSQSYSNFKPENLTPWGIIPR